MYLERMNYKEVEEYLKKDDLVVIPVGSIENHGLHMPLGTDTLIPNKIIELMEEKLNLKGINKVIVAPTINYGSTDDLSGFPGTITLGIDGLKNLLLSICNQFYKFGFRRFVILNGHGGNCKSIDSVGISMFKKGCWLACLNWWLIVGELNPFYKGGHGGGEETAGIMAVDPSLIKNEYINEPEGILNDVSEELKSSSWTSVSFKGANVTIPRLVNHLTKNGWLTHGMGSDNPTRANETWGKEMLDCMADYLIDFIDTFKKAELPEKLEE